MKVLIICAADRSNYFIALNAIKFINKSKLDDVTVCVLDNNKEIINYLKKNKIRYFNKNLDTFFYNIKNNYYDWLLNIWGFKIFNHLLLTRKGCWYLTSSCRCSLSLRSSFFRCFQITVAISHCIELIFDGE